MRTLGIYRVSNETFYQLPKVSQDILNAYCEGINAYLNTNPSLPLEFLLLGASAPKPFTPTDVLAWAKVISWMLDGNRVRELKR